jgi:uncharacterized membrane protein YagU involved in acid resistance
MKSKELLLDLVICLVAGYAATKATEGIQQALYRLTPEDAKKREEKVRPGPPFRLAAQKTAAQVGLNLGGERLEKISMTVHYGLGLAWGPAYGFLRHFSGMQPLGAGLATGATMSLIIDEALTPALGYSAPSRDYPTATHIRGFIAHLLFGLVIAASAEALYRWAPARLKSA